MDFVYINASNYYIKRSSKNIDEVILSIGAVPYPMELSPYPIDSYRLVDAYELADAYGLVFIA
jgi:hypothetical protein